MNEEQKAIIENMAGCNFAPSDIALFLGIEKKMFLSEYNNVGSDIRDAYVRGQLRTKYNVIDKQRDLAETGNITAAQIYLKEAENIRARNILDNVLYS